MPDTKQNIFSNLGTIFAYTAAGALDPTSIIKMQQAAQERQSTLEQQKIEIQKMQMLQEDYISKQNLRSSQSKYYSTMSNSPLAQLGGKVPEGMEITGYDAKGRPLVRKAASVIAEEQSQAAAKKDEAIRMKKLTGLKDAVDYFEKKINEIPVGSGFGGRLEGVKLSAEAALQVGEMGSKAAAYQSSVEGMRSQIARGLGEVGNLSETEQKAAINLLPKLTDNNETRAQKMQNFRDYIKIRTDSVKRGNINNNENSDFSKMSDDELRRIAGGK